MISARTRGNKPCRSVFLIKTEILVDRLKRSSQFIKATRASEHRGKLAGYKIGPFRQDITKARSERESWRTTVFELVRARAAYAGHEAERSSRAIHSLATAVRARITRAIAIFPGSLRFSAASALRSSASCSNPIRNSRSASSTSWLRRTDPSSALPRRNFSPADFTAGESLRP